MMINSSIRIKHTVVNIRGEELFLLPERAIFWKRKSALLIADLHLAKSGHFRKAGIPVPSYVHEEDLNRLSGILDSIPVEKIYLLGDLFHSHHNLEWKQFEKWRINHSRISVALVRGNHDLYEEKKMREHGIDVMYSFMNEPPFFFTHQQTNPSEKTLYNIFGHIHPAIHFRGRAKQSATLPCFWFSENFGVLPAFGNFTGNGIISPSYNDQVFFIVEGKVKAYTDQS